MKTKFGVRSALSQSITILSATRTTVFQTVFQFTSPTHIGDLFDEVGERDEVEELEDGVEDEVKVRCPMVARRRPIGFVDKNLLLLTFRLSLAQACVNDEPWTANDEFRQVSWARWRGHVTLNGANIGAILV